MASDGPKCGDGDGRREWPVAWKAARPQRAKPEGGRAANGGDVGRRTQEDRRENLRGGSDPARDNQPTISAGGAIGRTWPAWNT